MSKSKKQKNRFRAILVDTLPYEVPLWFTNDHFYSLLDTEVSDPIVNIAKKMVKKWTIPYEYRVSRKNGKERVLSVPHPSIQLDVCDFYAEQEALILYYTGISSNSLRAPHSVAKNFYHAPKKAKNKHASLKSKSLIRPSPSIEIDGELQEHASSYFKYNGYKFLYMFFESYEYHCLEKKYMFMGQVDISNCFPSIYTHTIAWAAKNKRYAKENSKANNFEQKFDQLMMNVNHGETNGIIVGPEFSRIFSEIILQKIDHEFIQESKGLGFVHGTEFEFKRYVDDYFIFTNSEESFKTLIKILDRRLAFYKLTLGVDKSRFTRRPFMSNLSIAKEDLSTHIDRSISAIFETNTDGKLVKISPASFSNKQIVGFKKMVAMSQAEYNSISGLMFSKFCAKFIDKWAPLPAQSKEDPEQRTEVSKRALIALDILSFWHAMDIRVRSTDSFSGFISQLLLLSEGIDGSELIRKKIFDVGRDALNFYLSQSQNTQLSFIEIQNIVLILSSLGDNYKLPEKFSVA